MADTSSSKLKSIQIVQSQENEDKQQVIKLVEKYNGGPYLKDILCGENKDLPIFVISICGRTRTGKSFMLNLMVKYLEETENWRNGMFPSVFEWKGGTESVTRGLWICPKIFKQRNRNGKEVGILLLDNQGLFDGEQTDGVSIAISGISTLLSFYQIFNLKESISENDLESIWRHLISDKDNQSATSATKLVFAVRDYLEESTGCGLKHGETYIEREKYRGTEDHKNMWKGLCESFPEIMCLPLPYPGNKVRQGQVKCMEDIENAFLNEVEKFFSKMFDPEDLNDTRNISTGEKIFETLKQFHNKTADEKLSFVNVFTAHGNQMKFDGLMNSFDTRFEQVMRHNPSNGQTIIEEYLVDGQRMFRGNSSNEYLKKLEQHMVLKINISIEELIRGEYENSLRKTADPVNAHSLEWNAVKSRICYFVGSNEEKSIMEQNVIVDCAELFYETLGEKLRSRFADYYNGSTLKGLEGADEKFISREFKENSDFNGQQPAIQQQCRAIWLKEKQNLHSLLRHMLLTFVEHLTEVKMEYLAKFIETQYKLYELFTWNDTHSIKVDRHEDSLRELIGYTLYQKTAGTSFNPSRAQRNEISKMAEQIRRQSDSNPIELTCVFILCHFHEKNLSCEPVYKVKKGQRWIFIDTKGRVYKDWESFEKDNKLPACLYCHPSEGEYDRKNGFQVGFTMSPLSNLGSKALKVLDVATLPAFAAGAIITAPIAAPVAIAVAGTYGILRGCWMIYDKFSHGESLSALTVNVEVIKELLIEPLDALGIYVDTNNISFLSLSNGISMFLLFNSRSIEGALKNIRKSYILESRRSNIETLNAFITKNSITFPEKDGERWTTREFLSEGLKALLLTAILSGNEDGRSQFLRDTVSNLEDSSLLQNLFDDTSKRQEQKMLFEKLVPTIKKVISKKRNTNYQQKRLLGIMYLPIDEVKLEVSYLGLSRGLIKVSECSHDESVNEIYIVARTILRFVHETLKNNNNLEKMIDYLRINGDHVVKNVSEIL